MQASVYEKPAGIAILFAVIIGLGASTAVCADTSALADSMTLPNFRFTDVDGVQHELYEYGDAEAVVLFFQINGCPIVRQSYPYFEEIKQQYADQGVQFLYINSNKWDTPESVIAERNDYLFTPPVLIDPFRALAHYLRIERSADTFVIKPGDGWRVVYHGMADDRFDYGLQRMSPKKFWLKDALDAILAGGEPAHAETIAKGCLIDMDTYEGVQFDKHVKPILEEKFGFLFPGGAPDEASARAADDRVLDALLTLQAPSGADIALSEDEGETLVAWLFPADASATH